MIVVIIVILIHPYNNDKRLVSDVVGKKLRRVDVNA